MKSAAIAVINGWQKPLLICHGPIEERCTTNDERVSSKHWAIGICRVFECHGVYGVLYWGVMRHVIETSLPLAHTHVAQPVQW